MKQRQKPKSKKRATVAAVLCFVAAIALVGTYTFKDYRKTHQEDKLSHARNEADNETKEKERSEETSTDAENIVINTREKPEEKEEEKEPEGSDADEDTIINMQNTTEVWNTPYFDNESKLLWPVNGAVILGYSMDKTVYFSTLDQYKYNPALIISGAEGDQVICGAPGIVKSIDITAETGTTVNVDIGNGYELFYGQLKEVPVKVGDWVEAKTVLGYVSQPTKYYSVEGSNVYFEMRKDGQPVNPVDYLE